MMRVIDLFSGCGGLSLGFQNAGFDIVAAFDNWQPAIDIYKYNFDHPIHNIDLSKIDNYSIFKEYEPDLIIGGPPCQDFSSAGKRNEQERADLTIKFAKIVYEVKPKIVVMENVERIITTQTLQQAQNILKMAGYGCTKIVLNASLCGVPQSRKRFFLIGILNETDDLLMPYLSGNFSDKPMTIFDYLQDSLEIEHYYRHPRSYARRGIFSVHEPSPTVRGVNRPIPPNYQFHEGDTCKDLSKIRPLTTKERSLLQTFPSNFIWGGKCKSDLEQAIGNAVPVKLGEYVANSIKNYLQKSDTYKYKEQTSNQLSLFS